MDMGVLREIPLQVLIVLLALALSACGNDESTPPGVPADSSVTSEIGLVSKEAALRTPPGLLLRLEVTKALRFDWSDVPGATTYRLLENPDGLSDFIQVGPDIDPGIETHKLIVPLYKRLNAQYALQACNSESCLTSDILHVQGHLEESVGYFKASNAASDDYFGGAVSLSGDGRTLAVGAQHEDSAATGVNGNQNDNSAVGSGAVYIFTMDEVGDWSQQAYLKASNSDEDDRFGYALSLSADGKILAVGASSEESGATGINGDKSDDSADYAGAVYVFAKDDVGDWSEQAYLKASNTDAVDQFGDDVSLSADGKTLAVGASGEDSSSTGVNGDQSDNSRLNAGAAYVFFRDDNGNWSQQAYFKASKTDAHDYFGISVSLSANGNTLAIGSPVEVTSAHDLNSDPSDNPSRFADAVYVFTRIGDDWFQQACLKASNRGFGDGFGVDVSLSDDGKVLAVGARDEGGIMTLDQDGQVEDFVNGSGAAYVFALTSNGNWSQQGYLKAS